MNFQIFLPGAPIFQSELEPWPAVKTTQIIPLFIGLCLYFDCISNKSCWNSPKNYKKPLNGPNRRSLPEKGPFFGPFWPVFHFWFYFSQNQDNLGPLIYDFWKLHYNRLHMPQKASHLKHLLPSYGFLWHDVPKK